MMEQFCASLGALPRLSPVQEILRDGLRHVQKHAVYFDNNVSKDSPFFSEFFHGLSTNDTCEDVCFGMLECVIIFCREKTLRMKVEEAPVLEFSILKHFENSGMWDDPARQTLVAQWYWLILPQRCAAQAL